jgi:dTDP-4-dehydrorhamnose reductase
LEYDKTANFSYRKKRPVRKRVAALAPSFPQYEFIFTDRAELDITNQEEVDTCFAKYLPQFCINAAAYTAVDKAETERELATLVNAEAVGHLALACTKYTARFIHVSTDYVFDGTASTPYQEEHPTNPVNFYGQTKLKGEELAVANHPSSLIIRTSWVYSAYGNNFVKTMLRLMADRESLNVVADQYGSPTYAADLAEAILGIISSLGDSSTGGIYHYSNEGNISWFDFATTIKELSASKCSVSPIPTSAYPTPAKRPGYSVMSKDKIKRVFSIPVKDWKESLNQCFLLLQNQRSF